MRNFSINTSCQKKNSLSTAPDEETKTTSSKHNCTSRKVQRHKLDRQPELWCGARVIVRSNPKTSFFSFRKGGELMGGFGNLYVTCNVYTTPLKKKKIDFSYIDLPFKYNWTPGRNGAIKNGRGPPQRRRKKSIKIWLEKKNLFGVPLFDAEKKKIWFLLVSPLLGTWTFLWRVFLSFHGEETFLQPGYCRVYQGKVDGGRRQRKVSQKDPRNKTVVTHTHTHTPKDINPLPKNPTVTLRIHTHNPVECHVDTPDRKYNEIRRWMCLFKSFRKKKKKLWLAVRHRWS